MESSRFLAGKFGRNAEPRCLLITSAIHQIRATATFRRAGLDVIGFGTDYRSERDHDARSLSLENTIMPSVDGFRSWGQLLREWVGYLVYRLRGWL